MQLKISVNNLVHSFILCYQMFETHKTLIAQQEEHVRSNSYEDYNDTTSYHFVYCGLHYSYVKFTW
jgi:hypothetical protein